ncbi:MAG: DUF6519 domain-containing protein [Caldilineaceae bacterium]
MKGDFTRLTFDPAKHYAAVLMQQGRVQDPADWNEEGDIQRHRVEVEAQDVIGACGAPIHAAGFAITSDGAALTVGAGRYYVDGLLCENEADVASSSSPTCPTPPTRPPWSRRAAPRSSTWTSGSGISPHWTTRTCARSRWAAPTRRRG